MRVVILLIVFLGGLFADTIHHRLSFIISDVVTKNDVEYLGINNNKIFFKNNAGGIESFPCSLTLNIYDSSNNKVEYDCQTNTYNGDYLKGEKTTPSLKKTLVFVGIFSIVMLIIILHKPLNVKPDISIGF